LIIGFFWEFQSIILHGLLAYVKRFVRTTVNLWEHSANCFSGTIEILSGENLGIKHLGLTTDGIRRKIKRYFIKDDFKTVLAANISSFSVVQFPTPAFLYHVRS